MPPFFAVINLINLYYISADSTSLLGLVKVHWDMVPLVPLGIGCSRVFQRSKEIWWREDRQGICQFLPMGTVIWKLKTWLVHRVKFPPLCCTGHGAGCVLQPC